jgi:hypothetical protein
MAPETARLTSWDKPETARLTSPAQAGPTAQIMDKNTLRN